MTIVEYYNYIIYKWYYLFIIYKGHFIQYFREKINNMT